MRAIFVDGDGFEEIDVFEDFPLRSTFTWDCFPLGDVHDVWVLDDGLFRPDVMLAKFGDRPNIPLPAYLLGSDGERTVGATMSIDELRVQASLQGRIGEVLAGGGQPSPLADTGFADY